MGDSSGDGNRKSLYTGILILVALCALSIRLVQLDSRPMHGDEANQAYKAGKLLETGQYIYDPFDHHGPTLYYLSLLPAALMGQETFASTTEFTYRIVPVMFGMGLILLLIPLRKGIGDPAMLYTGILIALSPAFVFYSRYFIQESLLVFFTAAAIVSAWRYIRTPSLLWATSFGASIGLMHATKETAIIAYASMVGAVILLSVPKLGLKQTLSLARERLNIPHLIAALGVALGVSVVLYTAFFTHSRGALDSILTYGNYLRRADGAGMHDKPPWYYLSLLAYTKRSPGPWWSEGFILFFAVIGALAAFRSLYAKSADRPLLRFIVLYTIIMTVLYAAIPYKTPWTLLGFLYGLTLLAGIGVAATVNAARKTCLRIAIMIVFAAGSTHLGYQALQQNLEYAADPRNPYVYAHTSTALLRLRERVETLAELHAEGEAMPINVIQPDRDYWPIPWYLRRFTRVGYWHELPEHPDAAIVIADPGLREELDRRLEGDYAVETLGLRPAVLRMMYIDEDLWKAYLERME